jgi:hypothetical protein
MTATKKNVIVTSVLLWFTATIICLAFAVFGPGLDIARKYDDYSNYWDFRLSFFLVRWLVSIPVWALVTWLLISKGGRKPA